MYLTKQTKSQIYLVIITTIIILSASLLIQNMAVPAYSNIGQAQAQQPAAAPETQATVPAAESGAAVQNGEASPPVVAEQPQVTDSTTEITATATVNMKPVMIIVAAVILLAAVGVGIYFLLPMIKNRFKNDDVEDLEEIDEPQDDFEDVAAEQPELDDYYNDQDDEPDFTEPMGDSDATFDFDYSGFDAAEPDEAGRGDAAEPEADAEPGAMNDIELCQDIERLTVKSNQLALYIRTIGNALDADAFPEITQVEEYDELPGETSGLEQEVARLKNKINLQVDYIEKCRKKQEDEPEKDDNKSEKPKFLQHVANTFGNMKRNEQMFIPKRNQDFVYVPISKFFGQLSQTLPDYNKNNAIELLIQHGIIDGNKYDTVYEGTRVLKVRSGQFEALTTEVAHNAGT